MRPAFHVKLDGFQFEIFGLREEIVQRFDGEIPCESADGCGSAVLLASVGIARDVRGGDVRHLEEFPVDVGFIIPGVEDESLELRGMALEGGFIDNLSPRGIYEYAAVLHS